MGFQLFPKEEYWLKSPYTAAEAIDVLAGNVVKPAFAKFGLLNFFFENKQDSYFEGVINDPGFKIYYRQNWYERGKGFMHWMPIVNGTVSQIGRGSSIHVTCGASNWIYFSQLMVLPIIAYLNINHAPLKVSIILILLYIISLFIQRYGYIRRLQKDKELLKSIFKAEEEGALL